MEPLNTEFNRLLRKAREEPAQRIARALGKVLAAAAADTRDLRKIERLDAVGRVSRIDIDGNTGTSRPSAMSQKTDDELHAIIAEMPSQIPVHPSSGDYRRRADGREATDELFLRSLRRNPITLIPASAAVGQDISLGSGKLTPIQRG
jgi:hypothetical protein